MENEINKVDNLYKLSKYVKTNCEEKTSLPAGTGVCVVKTQFAFTTFCAS